MSAKVIVLYPQPTDVEQFEADYVDHGKLLFEKLPIVSSLTASRPAPGRKGEPAPYYLIAEVNFNNADDMMSALRDPGMREVGGHAAQISSGGAPVVLVCGDPQTSTG